MNADIKKLQVKLLEIYKILKDELIKNKIDFFAIGGTAIGALRENGFIEWDDDIDLVIYEEDIERFNKIINNNARLSLNPQKNSDQWHPFIKVYDSETEIDSGGLKTNLFIDIMIAQNKRKMTTLRWLSKEIYQFLANMKKWNFAKTKSAEGIGAAIGYQIVKCFLFWIPRSFIKKKIKNICLKTKLDEDDGKRWMYHVRRNESITISKINWLKFEDTKMPVLSSFQSDYFDYFGDIMIKPSNQKEITNHDNKII